MVEFLFSGKGRVRRRDYALAGLFLIVSPVIFAVLGVICIHAMLGVSATIAPDLNQVFREVTLNLQQRAHLTVSFQWQGWVDALLLFLPMLAIGSLAATWSFFALTAKRMHDAGWTGWLSAIVMLPGIGAWMVYLVMILIPGQRGENRYGPNPRR